MRNNMFEGCESIKEGVFLSDDPVECILRIFQHDTQYGSGDWRDNDEDRYDQKGDFYYIEYEYAATEERESYLAYSIAFTTLEEAIWRAEKAVKDLRWIK